MIAQWSKGLVGAVQEGGCLLLCYLWCGWHYALQHKSDSLIDVPAVDTLTVNESYDVLSSMGHISEDCFVRSADYVVRFPWHHWEGSLLPGDEPRLAVERLPRVGSGHCSPMNATADGRVPMLPNDTVYDVAKWRRRDEKGETHFTVRAVQGAPGYFDPWLVSTIARYGELVDVRRVSIGMMLPSVVSK